MKHLLAPALCLTLAAILAGCGQQPQPSGPQGASKPAATPPPADNSASSPAPASLNAQETLWLAVATGDLEAVRKGLDDGQDVDLQEPLGGATLLMSAGFLGQTEMARLLIERGADIEKRNNDGSTPLLTAAFMCHPEVVELLIEKGADLNATNKAGATPLDTVSAEWSPQVKGIYEFVAGATQTPIDLERIEKARPEMVELLKKHGAKAGSGSVK